MKVVLLTTLVLLSAFQTYNCEEDYYKILGVLKNAKPEEIRRAFKKLSLKWHPDKNKSNAEKAKQMFIKIANAYEVLSNPEKRRMYDLGGFGSKDGDMFTGWGRSKNRGSENTYKGNFENNDDGGSFNFNFGEFFGENNGGRASFEDIFKSFFGDDLDDIFGGFDSFGSRNKKQKNKEKRGKKEKQTKGNPKKDKKKRSRIFDNDEEIYNIHPEFATEDIYKLNVFRISKIFNRNEIWLVLFYTDIDKDITTYAKVWKELSQKASGIFMVAIANCSLEEDICSEFKIKKTPTILLFPEKKSKKEIIYQGEIKTQAVLNFVNENMKSLVKVITDANVKSFLVFNKSKAKVLFFTERKSTSFLLKYFSVYFKKQLDFGEIRSSSTEITNMFNIGKFPTILMMKAVTDINELKKEISRGVMYMGEYDRKNLEYFIRSNLSLSDEPIFKKDKDNREKRSRRQKKKGKKKKNDEENEDWIKADGQENSQKEKEEKNEKAEKRKVDKDSNNNSIEVMELNENLYNSHSYCSEHDELVCVIHIVRRGKNPNIRFLQSILEEVDYPLRLFYVDVAKYFNFLSSFKYEDRKAKIILIMGTKREYVAIDYIKSVDDVLAELHDIFLTESIKHKPLLFDLNFSRKKDDL